MRVLKELENIFGEDKIKSLTQSENNQHISDNDKNMLQLISELKANIILYEEFLENKFKVLSNYGIDMNEHLMSEIVAAGKGTAPFHADGIKKNNDFRAQADIVIHETDHGGELKNIDDETML